MAPALNRRDNRHMLQTWLVIVIAVSVVLIMALFSYYMVDRLRNKQYREACKKDPYLTRKEFARRRKMTSMQRVQEEEMQRDFILRKALGSRSSGHTETSEKTQERTTSEDWKRWEANVGGGQEGESRPFLENHPATERPMEERPRRHTSPTRAPLLSTEEREPEMEERQSLWDRRSSTRRQRSGGMHRSPSPQIYSTEASPSPNGRMPQPSLPGSRSRSRGRSRSVSPVLSPSQSPQPTQAIQIKFAPAAHVREVSYARRLEDMPAPEPLDLNNQAIISSPSHTPSSTPSSTRSDPPTGPLPPVPTGQGNRSRSHSRSRSRSNSAAPGPFPDLLSPPPVHSPKPNKSAFLSPEMSPPIASTTQQRARAISVGHMRQRSMSNELLTPRIRSPSLSPTPSQGTPRKPLPRSLSPMISQSPRRKPVPERTSSAQATAMFPAQSPALSRKAVTPPSSTSTLFPKRPENPAETTQPTTPPDSSNDKQHQAQQSPGQAAASPNSRKVTVHIAGFMAEQPPVSRDNLPTYEESVNSQDSLTHRIQPVIFLATEKSGPTDRSPSPPRGDSPANKPVPDRDMLPSQRREKQDGATAEARQQQPAMIVQEPEVDFETASRLKDLGIPVSPKPPTPVASTGNLSVQRHSRDRSKSFDNLRVSGAPAGASPAVTPGRARASSFDNRGLPAITPGQWKLQVSILDQTGTPSRRPSPQPSPVSREPSPPQAQLLRQPAQAASGSGAIMRSSPRMTDQEVMPTPVGVAAPQLARVKHVDDLDTPLVSANFSSPFVPAGSPPPSSSSPPTMSMKRIPSFSRPLQKKNGGAGRASPMERLVEYPPPPLSSPRHQPHNSPPLFVSASFSAAMTPMPLFMSPGDFHGQRQQQQQQQQPPMAGAPRHVRQQQSQPNLSARQVASHQRSYSHAPPALGRRQLAEFEIPGDTMKQSVAIAEETDTMKQVGSANMGRNRGEVSFRLSGPPDLTPEFI